MAKVAPEEHCDTHRAHIMNKMEAANLAELVALATTAVVAPDKCSSWHALAGLLNRTERANAFPLTLAA